MFWGALRQSLMGGEHIAGSKYDGAKTDSREPLLGGNQWP